MFVNMQHKHGGSEESHLHRDVMEVDGNSWKFHVYKHIKARKTNWNTICCHLLIHCPPFASALNDDLHRTRKQLPGDGGRHRAAPEPGRSWRHGVTVTGRDDRQGGCEEVKINEEKKVRYDFG